MGQQQLLLLVLSTVIVGLATVAGIQAFSENQAQASQDALVQRGTSIVSDIQGLYGKPAQMGGVDKLGDTSGSDIVTRLGYDTKSSGTPSGDNVVPAQGAGSGGGCTITTDSDGTNGTADVECQSDDSPQVVTVSFDPDASGNAVSTSFSSS
ncbi:hypothetical protein [Salinibacter ruber]|uniref:hypothetical protein n=1 Tax=Salinibacter ruber TaxID=146919 RepID=UPI000E580713|nr:hypothetical protein [Salinibacter ruber]